jgi:ketosteroid isomerase-like protein
MVLTKEKDKAERVRFPGTLVFAAIAVLFISPACAPTPGETAQAKVLHAYLAAFNRHDAAAVAALLAPRVKWMTVDTDKLTVEGEGRDAVRTWLESYFKAQPDVRTEFLSLEQTGILLAVRERVTWTMGGKSRRQQSHAVYEIRDGLVRNVWYFPAVREDAANSNPEPETRKP